jgi:hypothetical protein
MLLEVHEVVAALLGALRSGAQPGHEPREAVVQVTRFLGLSADDERRARLVDEDVVHLVHDAEVAAALDPFGELRDHVVPEVVEAQLVVGGVGDVGGVCLPPGDRTQVQHPLVARTVVRVEHERAVVLDDAERQPEAVEDGSHPLRVALGEVVVDGDHVDATAGHRVERGSERRHERLALAGAHLRDATLVEHHRAHQLHIERAHAQLPARHLASGCEHIREHVIERRLKTLEILLLACPAHVRAALAVGMVALVVGRRRGRGPLRDLGPHLCHLVADLLVRQRRVVRFEVIDLRHDGAQAGEMGFVAAADKAGQDAAHGMAKYRERSPACRPGPQGRHPVACRGLSEDRPTRSVITDPGCLL